MLIILCAECGTKYRLDSSEIGLEGRHVKCVNCGNVWLQLQDDSEVFDSKEGAAQLEGDTAKKSSKSTSKATDVDYDEEGSNANLEEIIATILEEDRKASRNNDKSDNDEWDEDDDLEASEDDVGEEESSNDSDSEEGDEDYDNEQKDTLGEEESEDEEDYSLASQGELKKYSNEVVQEDGKEGAQNRLMDRRQEVGESSNKTDESEKIPRFTFALKLVVMVNLLVLLVLSFGLARDDIPNLLRPVYSMFGVYDSALLEFDEVSAVKKEDGSIIVNVGIINNSPEDKLVPNVKFSIYSKEDVMLYVAYFDPKGDTIKKDAVYELVKKIPPVPEGAYYLVTDIGNLIEMVIY